MSKKKKQKEKSANSKKAEEVTNKKNENASSATDTELLAIEKDKNLRLFAEFENFRKRTAKERIELFSTSTITKIICPI